MPHRCIACGRVVRNGSRALLDGCPECGGMKFTYQPPKQEKSEPVAPKRQPQHSAPVAKKRSRRARIRDESEKQQMERFESVHLLEEGTYLINLENLLAEEQFVLGLEDGRYIIPITPRLPR